MHVIIYILMFMLGMKWASLTEHRNVVEWVMDAMEALKKGLWVWEGAS